MDKVIKKNLLDLHFNKYLTIFSTSIIVAFTYMVGVVIAFLTKQIQTDNIISLLVLLIFSIIVLGLCAFFFFKSLFHIKNIPDAMRKL